MLIVVLPNGHDGRRSHQVERHTRIGNTARDDREGGSQGDRSDDPVSDGAIAFDIVPPYVATLESTFCAPSALACDLNRSL